MNKQEAPVLAITMGDPAGIGAEIVVKALADPAVAGRFRVVLLGDARFVADALRFTGSPLELKVISEPRECEGEAGMVYLIDFHNADPSQIPYGRVSPLAGRAAYAYVEAGVKLALAREVAAIVTGPLNKEALNQGGYHFSGHTEILAHLTGARDYAMMLVHDRFRVLHVSTHVSLREACDRVRRERVLTVIRLAHETGQRLGLARPSVGVAGLNPHAGEGGLFGDEEVREIAPAVRAAQAEGIRAEGPLPPDTLFPKARAGQYDFAVAMYHDQGHIPIKVAGFTLDAASGRWSAVSGVNVTLGLPLIRTSVDHGTAFGKAGKGTANAQSMIDALLFAAQLAGISEGQSP
ncbi:MAG: 4-hydroxythreonine-4-phosphate dehydrogenase PdxA [Bacillota bacterium]|nr:4-hydroxythreonine-4-phosphate dehydrogenase PdxA [Bacillota bacterium]